MESCVGRRCFCPDVQTGKVYVDITSSDLDLHYVHFWLPWIVEFL